ncbi:MAG: hypothetical protein U1F11_04410 [Steroidobacteraceae bacterium]
MPLDHRAHGAVEQHDALLEQFVQAPQALVARARSSGGCCA